MRSRHASCLLARLFIPLLSVLVCGGAPPARGAETAEAAAKPFLHPLFTNHMVLQRDTVDPVWGWTEPGKQVTVSFQGKSATATADSDGKWLARIGPFPVGGPFTLTVSGPQNATLNDVLVGDVWICSGQSNMEMGIGNANNAADEIQKADNPMIRLFTVPKATSIEPQPLLGQGAPGMSQWLVCTPENIKIGPWNGFSAAGFFFGRQLQQDLKIPIGLIHTSWGGTIAEAWTSGDALEAMADFKPAVEALRAQAHETSSSALSPDQAAQAWYEKNDPGSAPGQSWNRPEFQPDGWKTMKLPTAWENAGLPDYDGVVWFRKEIDLPAEWTGKDSVLHLGPIDDRDTTWFNGVRVGSRDVYNESRDYPIAGNLLKAGKNVIMVRVLDTGGNGGIWGSEKDMHLDTRDNSRPPFALAGDWLYKDSMPLNKAASPPPSPAGGGNNPNVPTVLYNGMVSPLIPFAIKGAVWYQGESNAGRAPQYRTLLPTMIRDWRTRFGVGDFPFYIVQLANFMDSKPEPTESAWAELREAQDYTAQTVGHSAIASVIDIGEAHDIHPKNKQEVGRRLALDAEALSYGQKIEYQGPTFKDVKFDGDKATIEFDHAGGGLDAKGGDPLKGFAIAGADKKFVWADAKIDGDKVVVSSPKIPHPAIVRYAWADNPVANLYNKEGLPANPFRTDAPR